MTGCVVVIEDTSDVGSDVLEHDDDEWRQFGEETGVGRVVYVSDGIAKMAISSKNEARRDGVEVARRPRPGGLVGCRRLTSGSTVQQLRGRFLPSPGQRRVWTAQIGSSSRSLP
ncbi:MAG: hypothetical protein J07HB67_00702 [halophilic archaeon J07HB67]|nr:MAG: hypothetical protein J07HB67_00702 [halophilic archaeon J07HB67]